MGSNVDIKIYIWKSHTEYLSPQIMIQVRGAFQKLVYDNIIIFETLMCQIIFSINTVKYT